MRMLIKGGRVVDPGHVDARRDLLIEDGVIREVAEDLGRRFAADRPESSSKEMKAPMEVIDAAGKIVCPGLIDMHVHLREPGHEYKETIASGTFAAARGGFTAVCCMPNTDPVNDSRQVTEYIIEKACAAGNARVYPVAAISRGLAGKMLSEYGELKAAGAVALTDDGRPVTDSLLMRRALEYAKGFGLPVISHCEELSLVDGGVMNEGALATRLGLAGIPNEAESIMVARDIALCERVGNPLHIAHVSTRQSVRLIREAKRRGVPVTAETAPHYFTLTESAVAEYDTHAKMNPPLRSEADRNAIREGLADGTLDAIATDHAPHSALEKAVEFDAAANGIIGLETSLPLGLALVAERVLTLTDLIAKMSFNPARILGLSSGLQPGRPADLTIIDPNAVHTVDAQRFASLSRNTPFDGWPLKGRAVLTMMGGRVTFRDI